MNGNLTITGRIKDIINRGGVKYNPSEIEEIIVDHPKVEMTAIIPMPDAVLGEKACCFVQLVAENNLNLEELTAYLRTKKISKKNILEIIAKKLKMSPMQIEKLDNFSKMKSWDSLAHLEILSALDAKLNNKVNKIKNISDIKSVKKIISILKKKSLIK